MPEAKKTEMGTDKGSLLLIGPPNVGKSVIFNHLTGLSVGVANYPGTTVEFTVGKVTLSGDEFELIDVPGTTPLRLKTKPNGWP